MPRYSSPGQYGSKIANQLYRVSEEKAPQLSGSDGSAGSYIVLKSDIKYPGHQVTANGTQDPPSFAQSSPTITKVNR